MRITLKRDVTRVKTLHLEEAGIPTIGEQPRLLLYHRNRPKLVIELRARDSPGIVTMLRMPG